MGKSMPGQEYVEQFFFCYFRVLLGEFEGLGEIYVHDFTNVVCILDDSLLFLTVF